MPSDVSQGEAVRLPAIPVRVVRGADELNFAEFPICCFSSNPTQRRGDVTTFEDEVPDPLNPGKTVVRRLQIIPASKDDPLGPLTPDDDWVLFGLIQLAKLQDWPKQLRFTRYQLLKLLGWQTNARDYQKLRDSLLRLKAYQFRYFNAFFDAKARSFVTLAFDLFTKVSIYEQENSRTRPKPNVHQDTFVFAASYVEWSDEIHQQFANRGVKGINFDFAKSLARPLTRRLFRFLDKNFHWRDRLAYDLESFVTAHLGLAAGQEFRDLKRTLDPALKELEDLGFLKRLTEKERYERHRRNAVELHELTEERRIAGKRKPRRFKYFIVFEKGDFDATAHEELLESEQRQKESPLGTRAYPLIKRGVSKDQALKLVQAYPDSIIQHQMEVVDWMEESGLEFKTSKGACLRDRIVNHGERPDPPAFLKRAAERAALAAKEETRVRAEAEREAKEAAEAAAVASFNAGYESWWNALGAEERTAVDAEVQSTASSSFTQRYLNAGENDKFGKMIWLARRQRIYAARHGIQLPAGNEWTGNMDGERLAREVATTGVAVK